MDNQPVLMTEAVTKRFGDFVAVNKVDFEMESKETLGIIGPNGAGKTTFINLITGFYPPDEGRVFSDGEDITHLSPARKVKRGIVRTFQLVHVFDNLSVFENLGLSYFRQKENKPLSFRMFVSSLRQPSIAERVQESLEMFELGPLRDEAVASLPLGSKKRLEVAMAFVSDPRIVIFDEPFSGLGDQEINEVVDVLKKYTHDKTILVIEHKVSKLEEFVDRLAVMHEGEIICCGECGETLNDPEVRRCYWKLET
ncbi:MAG: ABC transporter ATP-binding protein [Desulfobacteraceae bacterium]|jgi:branched-chain amino acid transport system ATP-binding protein